MDLSKEYKNWIIELKYKIRSTQLKAAVAINIALTQFYWELGKSINEKQTAWSSKFLETVSKDLQDEFPKMKGFSVSNLKPCRLFYQYFSFGSQAVNLNSKKPINNLEIIEESIRSQAANELKNQEIITKTKDEFSNHLVFRIPWGHIKIIITKIKNLPEANFYINQTIENSWSRDI